MKNLKVVSFELTDDFDNVIKSFDNHDDYKRYTDDPKKYGVMDELYTNWNTLGVDGLTQAVPLTPSEYYDLLDYQGYNGVYYSDYTYYSGDM